MSLSVISSNPLQAEHFRYPAAANRQQCPGFELLQELGRGGMGVVYKARQTALNRIVALKMVLSGAHSLETDRLRFLAEAEAVAAVKHPNVVQVYEFGVSENLPYFAMEFLDGGSLAACLADRGRMPAADAAEVVEQVARGVQAAHDVGVIHRDLKPGNILFTHTNHGEQRPHPTTPRSPQSPFGHTPQPGRFPKVTDFGLAKRGAGYDLTLTGVIMGTPAYMAPEQAKGEGKFVGPAADIYALGVILYECLAGRPPFYGEEQTAIIARVVASDPPPLRRFAPDVPRDLELICLKCLEKSPADRYPSAGALADDLRRFLSGEPVSVRPAGLLEKGVKWVRRYPSRAALYGLTLLVSALIGLTAGVVDLWRHAEAGRKLKADALAYAQLEHEKTEKALIAAEDEKTRAEQAQAAALREKAESERAREGEARARAARSVDLAYREYDLSNIAQARRYLDECPPALRSWEWHFVHRYCTREARIISTGPSAVLDVKFAPDTGNVITAGSQGLREWDSATGTELTSYPGGAIRVALSGDGKLAAALGLKSVTLFDRASGKPVVGFAGGGLFIALSRDGSTMLIGGEGKAAIRNVKAANELPVALGDFHGWCGTISPDDRWAAIGGQGRTANGSRVPMVKIVPFDGQGNGIGLELRSGGSVRSIAFDASGRRLAVGCEDGTVTITDHAAQTFVAQLRVPTGSVMGLAFSPDGSRLAAAAADRTARVWDIPTGEECFALKGHDQPVTAVAFAPDGRRLATSALDGTVRVWDITAPPDVVRLAGLTDEPIATLTITEDRSRVVVCGGGSATLRVFDGFTGQMLWGTAEPHGGILTTVTLSADRQRIIAADEAGLILEWDLRTGSRLSPRIHAGSMLKRPVRLATDFTHAVSWDSTDGTVTVFDARSGKQLHQTGGHTGLRDRPAISPDGRMILTAELDRTGRIWDADTGREMARLHGHVWPFRAGAFSPDGERIATIGTEGWTKIWDTRDGREVLTFLGHNRTLVAVGYSPDGTKLLTLDSLGTLRIHDGPRRESAS